MNDPADPGPGQPETASAFEALLWDLALRFVDTPAEQVDAAIRDAQRQLCEALDLDRSVLWQTAPDDETELRLTHVYERRDAPIAIDERTGSARIGESLAFPLMGVEPFPAATSAKDSYPWILPRLRAGLTSAISSIDDLPAGAAIDARVLRQSGTVSTVIVPLKAESGLLGCVTFASTTTVRAWSAGLIRRFELVAQVFARALNAKRVQRSARADEARLSMAAAAAGAGLWEYDIATGRVHATEVAQRLLGVEGVENLTVERILSIVHPEDRDAYAARLAWFRDHADTYSQEYRLLLPDGTIRWIRSQGAAFTSRPGEPPDRVFGASTDITERRRTEEQLRQALADLQTARDQLQHENLSLRDEAQRRGATALVVGTSPAIRTALTLADQVAPTGATVLLLGETGTGKERFANYIHAHSPRHARTIVRVNCAAIPSTLIESELFGREKGAYTGALSRQIGRFEMASGSTIFLDEIGDLPPEVQVKLLRVIEERRVERLGNPRPVDVDVRIIAATHRDLRAEVAGSRFREDLYYRLNVFPIALPPLRERLEDIPLLARALVDELAKTSGRRFESLSQASLEELRRYPWPGNIRELRNLIERAMITCVPPTLRITLPLLPQESRAPLPGTSLKDVERAHILDVLGRTGWRIRGAHGAAAILGVPPTTLEHRMKRLGISRPRQDTSQS
jgi:formate hydrogenlyase transcriptional activator